MSLCHQLLIQSDRASHCEPFTIGPDCSQYRCNCAAPTINFTHQRPWSGLGVSACSSAVVQSTGWFERGGETVCSVRGIHSWWKLIA